MINPETTTHATRAPEPSTELGPISFDTTRKFIRSLKSSTKMGIIRWHNIYNIAMFRFPEEYQNDLLEDFADETACGFEVSFFSAESSAGCSF